MTIPIKGRRIALIGGAGFIGHNLALKLKALGADVHIIDGLSVNNLLYFASANEQVENRKLYLDIINQRLDMLRKNEIPVHVQDARDYHLLNKALKDINPDVIVHLAAIAHANKSNKDPFSTFDHSLRTLENALDYARGNVEHFIYFSSSMVYGNFTNGIVDEETVCNPLGIYGALKFSGEKMVIGYNQVFDLPYTIVRPSALYGARCVSRRVGQIFIENAFNGKEIMIMGDGSDALDFTYIDDFCQGIIKCVERKAARNEIFNITYGEARAFSEMAEILKDYFGKLDVKYVPKDKLMPDRGTLSVDKARDLIGYEPEFELKKGYLEYIEWYQELFDGMK